jgi:hypothetical protein
MKIFTLFLFVLDFGFAFLEAQITLIPTNSNAELKQIELVGNTALIDGGDFLSKCNGDCANLVFLNPSPSVIII